MPILAIFEPVVLAMGERSQRTRTQDGMKRGAASLKYYPSYLAEVHVMGKLIMAKWRCLRALLTESQQ